jgi:predicted Zn-ribbon and HTH transcriptional regulator
MLIIFPNKEIVEVRYKQLRAELINAQNDERITIDVLNNIKERLDAVRFLKRVHEDVKLRRAIKRKLNRIDETLSTKDINEVADANSCLCIKCFSIVGLPKHIDYPNGLKCPKCGSSLIEIERKTVKKRACKTKRRSFIEYKKS